jgi:hypothetical protein
MNYNSIRQPHIKVFTSLQGVLQPILLYNVIRQAKPKLYCFSHLHKGCGFQEILWKPQGIELGVVFRDSAESQAWGDGRTVLVNAAVMNHGEEHNNKR